MRMYYYSASELIDLSTRYVSDCTYDIDFEYVDIEYENGEEESLEDFLRHYA